MSLFNLQIPTEYLSTRIYNLDHSALVSMAKYTVSFPRFGYLPMPIPRISVISSQVKLLSTFTLSRIIANVISIPLKNSRFFLSREKYPELMLQIPVKCQLKFSALTVKSKDSRDFAVDEGKLSQVIRR